MAKTIKYNSTCYRCGKVCTPKDLPQSFLHRHNRKWLAHCYKCYKDREAPKAQESK